MDKKMKNDILKEIGRAGNKIRLKEILDKAFNKGYISEVWFTDSFEKQCTFLHVNDMVDEMNQTIKEFNGETTEIKSPKKAEATEEVEPSHIDVEGDHRAILDTMSCEEVDEFIKNIPTEKRFLNKLQKGISASFMF